MSMTVWSRVGLLTLVLGMSLLVSAALAQKGELFADFPEYIPATETRYEGTVVTVMSERSWPESWRRMNPALSGDEAPKLKLMRMLGTHLLLETDDGAVDVHVGPTSFLDACDFRLEPGDHIFVIGSVIHVDNRSVVVAREIKRGDRTVTLRNKKGVPPWRRGASPPKLSRPEDISSRN